MDKDYPSALDLLTTYFNLKQCGRPVEIRRSASGRGYHMIVRGLPISYEDSLRIRRTLGECKNRLRFDEEVNHKPRQILWREKTIDGKRYVIQPLTEEDILRLPFCSRPPRAVFKRMRREN